MCPESVERGKLEVSGGLPPVASPLLSIYCLGRWSLRRGGQGYAKNSHQLPRDQVETSLLSLVWLRQD